MALRRFNMPSLPSSHAGGVKGKAWGNTLSGGYKTQRRDVAGKFATSAQSRKAKIAGAREYKTRATKANAKFRTPRTKAQKLAGAGFKPSVSKKTGWGALGASVLGAGFTPSFSLGPRGISGGIAPKIKLGKYFTVSTNHSASIEHDLIERGEKKAKRAASRQVRKVLGSGEKGTKAGNIFDAAIGHKRDSIKVGGTTFRAEGRGTQRRIRYQHVPGGPVGVKSGKAKPRPQDGSGKARTITNKTKGKTGIKAGAKSGGGRGQRRKKKGNQRSSIKR